MQGDAPTPVAYGAAQSGSRVAADWVARVSLLSPPDDAAIKILASRPSLITP
jgi:hypothetical protein